MAKVEQYILGETQQKKKGRKVTTRIRASCCYTAELSVL